MKIRYNIADQKKINLTKFVFLVFVLFVFSAALMVAGVYQLSTNARQFREDKAKLQQLKEKSENIKKREAAQTKEISKIKTKWSRKLQLLNSIIDDKVFPYLAQLDKLESLFPEGVFIQNIILNPKSNDKIQMTIAAISYQKLLEAYKVFFKYDMIVFGQAEEDGLFRATITLRLKNESKST